MKRYIAVLLSILRRHKSAVLIALLIGVMVDVVGIAFKSDLIIFGLLGLYILAIRIYKLPSKIAFFICFFILTLLLFEFIATGASLHTEKAAVWLFLFMGIGIVQEFIQRDNEKS